ncbi:MAG: formimidoylglutamate deiminase [Candidatus Dormibacteraeota bacterium]|uniref:Formimidoylglutamate deiminase n=1 Tax=Candidatus Dormiibacter inghamiae TaxID=3127013 RepID=A0A934N7H0_9BACT|nr:formimidoylglutamate deiminase [Candidatus Dormibacteraeota bacterium]MBJ7607343.1 formimidoylglutamate deiminase [Candidatus Dormibacteraeota bacterium]
MAEADGAKPQSWFADHALLPEGHARDVLFQISDGRFTAVTPNASPAGAGRLPGIALPGFANVHSHAFHRALRGRAQDSDGTFWSWRERMYAVAERLTPDRYLELARATYAEMALAGITAVGEFHYLHHGPGGVPYADPNAMGEALLQAAREAGVRIALLDACYLAGGLTGSGHTPLEGVQLRFGDGDVDGWAGRFTRLAGSDTAVIGAALHSVRAVPAASIRSASAAAAGVPLHVHVSEQPAENEVCRAFYGYTPAALLQHEGALSRRTTAVHATHLSQDDVALLGGASAQACLCPTTERDLADGIGPALQLHEAGVRVSLGSDQHAVIDLLEEARALEMDQRLASGRRGRFTPGELLAALTRHEALGFPEAGRLAVGERADLVGVRLDSPRTAGSDPAQVLFSATAADVDIVLVDGGVVVREGRHRLGDIGRALQAAIEPLWR